ncbi:MAG: polysaccharide deacetylase family protein [Thermoleophilaceae bacterium]
MPGWGQLVETLECWERFPGRQRVDSGVALTFDDGPDPDATPAVLDALERLDARATFFMVGEQLLVHHELGRAVAQAGHAVGLHGFRHVEHAELDDPREDLLRGLDAIESATGERPRICRPPYGRFSESSFAACRELELEPVYWSAWGMDWEPFPAERIVDLATRDLEEAAILLLHDSPRYAPRPSARPTAEALEPIVAELRERGLSIVALD